MIATSTDTPTATSPTSSASSSASSSGSSSGSSGQALEEMLRLARRLRMPYLRAHAPEVLATARAQRWDPAEALRVLLAEEIAGRDEATIRARRKKAGFPAGKTFEVWNETASSIPRPTQQALRTLEWVDRHENLCVCGPSGTGKSHCETGVVAPSELLARGRHGDRSLR